MPFSLSFVSFLNGVCWMSYSLLRFDLFILLKRELRKGSAFDGWSEGALNFPPTYKYVNNSEKYIRDDHKGGRRSPAWCDRILTFGKGVRYLKYKRAEQKLSDRRPVSAVFMVEMEVFCHRKLQKALTLTNAEVEYGKVMPDLDFEFRVNRVIPAEGLGNDFIESTGRGNFQALNAQTGQEVATCHVALNQWLGDGNQRTSPSSVGFCRSLSQKKKKSSIFL